MHLPLPAACALLTAAALFTGVAPAHAADPAPITVVTSDFEDGTAQGWAARGGETVAASDAAAHGGTGSLAVTGRTARAGRGPRSTCWTCSRRAPSTRSPRGCASPTAPPRTAPG
nr:hypothetical protein GCM10020092_062640 [Actinoplanes digitatis]